MRGMGSSLQVSHEATTSFAVRVHELGRHLPSAAELAGRGFGASPAITTGDDLAHAARVLVRAVVAECDDLGATVQHLDRVFGAIDRYLTGLAESQRGH